MTLGGSWCVKVYAGVGPLTESEIRFRKDLVVRRTGGARQHAGLEAGRRRGRDVGNI